MVHRCGSYSPNGYKRHRPLLSCPYSLNSDRVYSQSRSRDGVLYRPVARQLVASEQGESD